MGTQGFKYHGPFSGAIMASLITLVVMFAVAVVIFRAIAYLACLCFRLQPRLLMKCKKTGKIMFRALSYAQDSLRFWFVKNPDAAHDHKRFRIYKCSHCHCLHIGRYRGDK